MSDRQHPQRRTTPIYKVLEQWRKEALKRDGSLFTPGRPIWSRAVVEDLYERFVQQPDESKDSFWAKFQRQLRGAPDETLQLAAEILYIYFLVSMAVKGDTKRTQINKPLTWMRQPIQVPSELASVCDVGLVNPGQAFNNYRPYYLAQIIAFIRDWKALDEKDRDVLLSDPWAFKELVESRQVRAAAGQRHALLHLVHPDTFEDIVSTRNKNEIAEAYSEHIPPGEEDIDRQLLAIRKALEEENPEAPVRFYYPPFADRWRKGAATPPTPPDKPPRPPVVTAQPLNLILYGPPGTGKTYEAIARAVELCDRQTHSDRKAVRARYRELNAEGRIAFVTFHQSFGYEEFVEGLRPVPAGDTEPGGQGVIRYEVQDGIFKRLARQANVRRTSQGQPGRVNVDTAQVWKMSLGDTYDPEQSHVYEQSIRDGVIRLGYGGGIDFSGCESQESIRAKLEQAGHDVVDRDYRITSVHTLKNRMQVGDLVIVSQGNTQFRAIGRVSGPYRLLDGSDYRQARGVEWLLTLDEPHPVEEILSRRFSQMTLYRVGNEILNRVALSALLAEARNEGPPRDYVLIVDEINRGNVSKILGELITLLEPDKRIGQENELRVQLPYSNESFGVPANLHVIGTMNTADRSIAFLDTALRRRFEFREMMPDAEIVRAQVGDEGEVEGVNVADILDTINERIAALFDRDHQIGHAFLLGVTSLGDLRSRFLGKLIPQLQEYFYGDWERVCAVLGCPVDPESGTPLRHNSRPIVMVRPLVVDSIILGDVEPPLHFTVNPELATAEGDELRSFFTGVLDQPPVGDEV